jgi:VanZ like family
VPPRKGRRRAAAVALAIAGLLFIARATLTSSPDPNGLAQLTPLWCIVCGELGGSDVIANLLLFLPFAMGLRLAGLSWRRTVLIAAAVSLTVELLQLVAIPGRDASLSDLLTNTGSGAIGATLAPWLLGAVRPSATRATKFLAAGTAAWLAGLALSAWLLSPAVESGALQSGWAGATGERDVFFGEIHQIRLDGILMPRNGTPPDSAEIRRRLGAGEFRLDAEVNSGGPVSYPSWIYKLKSGGINQLTLFQLRRHAGVAVPIRAMGLRLRAATVTLPAAFPDVAGRTVWLEASAAGGVITLHSTYSGVTRGIEFGLSPAYGWRLISPFQMGIGNGVRWFTALLLAVSVLPLAYWAAWARKWTRWILPLGITAGLVLPSAVAGFPPVHWSEWAAAAVGALAGWALQRGAAYLERRCASLSASDFSSS